MNKWKKYGAAALAGVLLIGVCVQGDALLNAYPVNAEETEETQRVTLNIVGDDDETEAASEITKTAADETDGTEETAGETVDTEASDSEKSDTEESERVTLNVGGSSNTASDSETEDSETDEAETETADAEEETGDTEASSGEAVLGEGSSVDRVEAVSGSIVTTDVSELVENCMPSIVSITSVVEETDDDSSSEYYYYYADDGSIVFEDADTTGEEEETTASGIIIAQNDTELLIATNYHVVSDADEILIGFSVEAEDEEDLTVYGRVKGTNSSADLAVVAVELSDIEDSVLEQLRIANLGSSEDLKIGQATVAISNALGYGVSATTGIISALNREVELDGVSMELILTDAAVNLGSSGGALLNASGEVIGICIAKETEDSAEGMGYFIPIDTAVPVLEQLINKETRDKLSDSERGYIGATVLSVSDEAVETYNMPAGAFVYEVTSGSAAEEAGLKNGDIITALEGESVTSSDDLIEKMSYYAPGETITLVVYTANNGSYEGREVEVTLQEGSSSTADSSDDEEDAEAETEDSSSGRNGRSDAELPDDGDENSADGFGNEEGRFGDGTGSFEDDFEDGFEDYNSQFN